ncbi:MAG: hypothetical protein U5K56_01090 [Halioglobus sp.]|nr:hypothetical protein [Halioglobus sp.]
MLGRIDENMRPRPGNPMCALRIRSRSSAVSQVGAWRCRTLEQCAQLDPVPRAQAIVELGVKSQRILQDGIVVFP